MHLMVLDWDVAFSVVVSEFRNENKLIISENRERIRELREFLKKVRTNSVLKLVRFKKVIIRD